MGSVGLCSKCLKSIESTYFFHRMEYNKILCYNCYWDLIEFLDYLEYFDLSNNDEVLKKKGKRIAQNVKEESN